MKGKNIFYLLIFLVVSSNSIACDDDYFRYSDKIESLYSDRNVDKMIPGVVDKSHCYIYNKALDYIDINRNISGALFCNSAWKGSSNGAYNCAIYLINGKDKSLGLNIIKSLDSSGYKRAGYYLLKKKLLKNEASHDDLEELKKYVDILDEAKILYKLLACKKAGKKTVEDCLN